jgi:hypothetical protein
LPTDAAGYSGNVGQEQPFDRIRDTMEDAAAALRNADVPFLLGGGLAIWARGGPATGHDIDLMVKPEDAERGLDVLEQAGMRPEKPPGGWLYKAWNGDILVDLIFKPVGDPVDEAMFARADAFEVSGVPMLVMSLEDVMVTKLQALDEHELDYERPLEFARSLREQIDWEEVRSRTDGSPYAKAFFTLLEELGILGPTS